MNPNGLLFLWWLDRNNPDDRKAVAAALEGWPLWACGLLGRAMTGYYAGSGDKHILEALEKAYGADPDCLRSITGNMSNPWPAFDTYSWTGNQGIADALDAMFKKEGAALLPSLNRYRKAPDLKPGTTVDNAHVVEFLESTTPWAVGYLWTGDARYLEAALGWHDLLERVAMQPHGVPVADEWYGPTGAFRGSETCDVAGYVWSQICLLSVTGEGRMADRAGAGVLQRRAGHRVARFQDPRLFPEPQPVRQPVAGLSARAQGRRRRLPAQALAALLHGRAQPHRALVRDAHVDGHLRQRPGGHLLRPLQGDGAGGRPRAGRDRLPDRLSLQRDHRDLRAARAGGGLPARLPHSRLVHGSRP